MASKEELEAMGITNQDNISNNNRVSLTKCEVCGKEIAQNAVSCPHCGAKNKNNNETASIGIKVICFLIPLIGIIIFAVNISTRPKYAKGCLIASLLPTIIGIICIIMFFTNITPVKEGVFSTQSSSYNTTNNYNTDDSLPYCKYKGCYNKVPYSFREYCDKHIYMEDWY